MVRFAWTIVGAAIIAMAASGAQAYPVHIDPRSRHNKSRREDGESETYHQWKEAYDKRNRLHAMKRSHDLRIPPTLEALLKKRDLKANNAAEKETNSGLIKRSESQTEEPPSFFGANTHWAAGGGILGATSIEKVNQMLADYDRILKEAGRTPGTKNDAGDPKTATNLEAKKRDLKANNAAEKETNSGLIKRSESQTEEPTTITTSSPTNVPTTTWSLFGVNMPLVAGDGILGGTSIEKINQMIADYDRILKEAGRTPGSKNDAGDPNTATKSDDQNGSAENDAGDPNTATKFDEQNGSAENDAGDPKTVTKSDDQNESAENEPKAAVRKREQDVNTAAGEPADCAFRKPIRRSEPQAEEPVTATSTSSASASSPTWSFIGSIKGWANSIQPMRASTEWAEQALAAYNRSVEAGLISPGAQKVAVELNTGPQSKDQGNSAQNEPPAAQSEDKGAIDSQHHADSPPVRKRRSAGPDPLPLSTDADAVRFAGNKAYLIYRTRNVEEFVQGDGNRPLDNSGTQKFRKLAAPSTLNKVKLTYYWLMFQQKGVDEGTTELRSCDGKTVFGTASNRFAEEIRMEGTGFLLNGKVLNLGDCNCGDGTNTFNCFDDISKNKEAPFGYGVKNIPLKPFVSVANNDKNREVGTVLYAPDLDGFKLPNGKVHNGCLQKVDSIGRGGVGSHIDFFALKKNIAMNYIDKKLNKDYIDVQWDAPRCQGKLLDYGIDAKMDFDKI